MNERAGRDLNGASTAIVLCARWGRAENGDVPLTGLKVAPTPQGCGGGSGSGWAAVRYAAVSSYKSAQWVDLAEGSGAPPVYLCATSEEPM